MANVIASIIWRRLGTPGHDACRLVESDSGWHLEGTAEGVAAQISYRVTCDHGWRTQQGQVQGWFGVKSVDFSVIRTIDGAWIMNGMHVSGLEDCIDLDFGFTPATNLLQLRRLALAQEEAMTVPVAWLDVSPGTLQVLNQRYERRSETTYWYEASKFDYRAMIEVASTGFIRRYPGLWEAEN